MARPFRDNLLSLVGKLSPARRRSKEPLARPGLYTIHGRYGRRVGCEMTVGDGRSASGGATISGDPVALPLGRLERWMRDHVDGFRGPLIAERFEGGQSNPTYQHAAATGTYVLRRKPLGHLLPSAHAVDREYRVIRALARTAVPVPRVYALCEDDAIIGSTFYIMEFVDGRIFWDQRLPGLTPAERRTMFDSMNGVIAALHSVDHVAVGLNEFGRPGNYMARQVGRWTASSNGSPATSLQKASRASSTAIIAWTIWPSIRPSPESSVCSTGNCRPSATRSLILLITL